MTGISHNQNISGDTDSSQLTATEFVVFLVNNPSSPANVKVLQKCIITSINMSDPSESSTSLSSNICLTWEAVYRLRDPDAILTNNRKPNHQFAKYSKMFNTMTWQFYPENIAGSVLRIIEFISQRFARERHRVSHFKIGSHRSRQNTIRAPRKITTDHDMRPIRLRLTI